MHNDLKLRNYFRMISTGFHLGGLPEGADFQFGQVVVETAGTAVQVKPAISAQLRGGVMIRLSNYDTAGDVAYVGLSDSVSATTGFMVDQYYPCWLEIDNLSSVWVDASHDDVGISYMAF